MPSIVRGATLAVAAALALSLAACTPSPEQAESPSPAASASASPSSATPPTPTPSPDLALPDCETIYSPAMVASLIAESRVSDADDAVGRGSLDEAVSAVLDTLDETVSCGWYLPASESGSTTTVARIDDAAKADLEAAFAAGGFTAATTADGELYSIRVEEEFGTYEESHLVLDSIWIGTLYAGGSAEALTLDAAAQLLP